MQHKNAGGNAKKRSVAPPDRPVSLKSLAAHLKLSPTSLSLVLNDSPSARSIPQDTKDRILAAARQFNYRPNFLARSLRAQRSYTIGVLVPEVSEGYSAMVLAGIQDQLLEQGYFYVIASHRHDLRLLEQYRELLLARSIEGVIAVDTPLMSEFGIPAAAISRRDDCDGVTNIVLNHEMAATVGVHHLVSHGHRRIAFMKGQAFSSDTEPRWQSICRVGKRMGLNMDPLLMVQLEGNSPSPEVGYVAAKKLLATQKSFSALFAFNDISAIGAIRAFRDAGYRVPEDISVIGFDDIYSAAFQNPPLTTIRQPLQQMGRLAAEIVLRRVTAGPSAPYQRLIVVDPELVIRESVCECLAIDTKTKTGSRKLLRALAARK